MNKRGQLGIVAWAASNMIFLIYWGLGGGALLAEIGQRAIAEQSLVGIEAFFLDYLNLWVFLFFILGNLAFFVFGGRRV